MRVESSEGDCQGPKWICYLNTSEFYTELTEKGHNMAGPVRSVFDDYTEHSITYSIDPFSWLISRARSYQYLQEILCPWYLNLEFEILSQGIIFTTFL